MKHVLISWGFNPRDGKLELDCYLEILTDKDTVSVPMIYIRATTHNYQVSLFRVPVDWTRDQMEFWFTCNPIKELNEAKVHENEITRKRSNTNSVNFIMGEF